MHTRTLVPTLSVVAVSLGATALMPVSAEAAYDGARYSVAVTSPELGSFPKDTRNFLLSFTLSSPRTVGQTAGTFTYRRPGGGPTVCSGRLVVVATDAGYPVEFGEVRKSPSIKRVKKSTWRASIKKARSWCKGGKWRMGLRAAGNAYSALENEDGSAPARLQVWRRSGGGANGYALLKR